MIAMVTAVGMRTQLLARVYGIGDLIPVPLFYTHEADDNETKMMAIRFSRYLQYYLHCVMTGSSYSWKRYRHII